MATRSPASERVRSAFAHHKDVRIVLDAALNGTIGTLHASDDSRAVRADVGCYSFFGGPADPGDPFARGLMGSAPVPIELMYGDDDGWKRLAVEIHGAHLDPRPMRWFRGDELDPDRLDEMLNLHHDGYELRDLDAELAAQLGDSLHPHGLQTFDDPEHLLRDGLGIGVVRGSSLVCAATSYAMTAEGVEIAISTHRDHRGKGLAQAASAGICLAGLDRGIEPHWHASNPVSQRLAVRLGFHAEGEVPIDFLTAD